MYIPCHLHVPLHVHRPNIIDKPKSLVHQNFQWGTPVWPPNVYVHTLTSVTSLNILIL